MCVAGMYSISLAIRRQLRIHCHYCGPLENPTVVRPIDGGYYVGSQGSKDNGSRCIRVVGDAQQLETRILRKPKESTFFHKLGEFEEVSSLCYTSDEFNIEHRSLCFIQLFISLHHEVRLFEGV